MDKGNRFSIPLDFGRPFFKRYEKNRLTVCKTAFVFYGAFYQT